MQKILNVTQLNAYIKRILLTDPILQYIQVRGTITSYTKHRNGILYLTLSDENSSLQCIQYDFLEDFPLQENQIVDIEGHIQYYSPRGACQLVIRRMIDTKQMTADLKQNLFLKLQKENVFEQQKKLILSQFPENIAVLTSDTGAVIEDIRMNALRRWPLTHITVFPVRVQGSFAIQEISEQIVASNKGKYDAILLARGGGAKEDFDIFDAEPILRSIASSKIPIITALGHQINQSLSDKAAYKSVSTPTEAVEYLLPNQVDILYRLAYMNETLNDYFKNGLARLRQDLEMKNVQYIGQLSSYPLSLLRQTLNETHSEFLNALQKKYSSFKEQLQAIEKVLYANDPTAAFDKLFVLLRQKDRIVSIEDLKEGDQIQIVGRNKILTAEIKKDRTK